MHRCLVAPDENRVGAGAWAATTVAGGQVFSRLDDQLRSAALAAPALAEHRDGLRRRFAPLTGLHVRAHRIHGDLHLGQALSTTDGWKLIDFEGEPTKSMAQRRAVDSPWRDVAGLLRSISYAAAASGAAHDEAARWADQAAAGVLAGYGAAIYGESQLLLDAYLADRAAYEVVYESRNRPDWVAIPMREVARLATAD